MKKRRYIVRISGKPEICLYSESIAYALAEIENGNVLEIIN